MNENIPTNLSRCSHKMIEVECESKISSNCKNKFHIEYRSIEVSRKKHNGKLFCNSCRLESYKDRNNPNCKYKLDDNYFNSIDTNVKAYILGLIAGDGSINYKTNSISYEIHPKDIELIHIIRNAICKELPIHKCKNRNIIGLRLNSTRMVLDIARHLMIVDKQPLSNNIKLPNLNSLELYVSFIRGYFDADGHITNPEISKKYYPVCGFSSNSKDMLESIKNYFNIPSCLSKSKNKKGVYNYHLEYSNLNALDFMGKLYSTNSLYYCRRKYELFLQWCTWTPIKYKLKYTDRLVTIQKCDKNAVIPSKSRISDSGYDLTIIGIEKQIGDIIYYKTGIRVRPTFGYYFVVVPRSSICKTGYMLANSVGIIDRAYCGEILIPLIKVDNNMPDLTLPCRIAQMIPQQIVHFPIEEGLVNENTTRGTGGFGSTGK